MAPFFMSNEKKLLEEIAKQTLTVDPANDIGLNEAQRFVSANNIKPGDTKVPCMLIYHMYALWRNEENLENRSNFFKQFKTLGFKSAVKGRGIVEQCYKLDATNIDLSKDKIYAARKFYYNAELQKKKTKKLLQNFKGKKAKKQD